MELSLLAYSERHFTGGGGVGCSFGVRNIQNAVTAVCNGVTNNGKWLTVSLPQAELAKIPSGGIWTARLELNERLWGGAHPVVAAFNADIELSVTDDGNIQLYLPAFGNAEPRVDLNLRTQPLSGPGGTGMVSGRSVIDACLYDGYNSNSNTFITRISDPLSTNGDYSVRHVASVGDDAHNRITYRVVTQTANQGAIERRSDVPLSQNGMHMADIRAVRLPGVPYPVVCTPFPIQLITEPFPQNSKAAGHYSGTLKVEFTPSTTAP